MAADTTNASIETNTASTATNENNQSASSINGILSSYLQLKNALANDNGKDAATAGGAMVSAFKNFDLSSLPADKKKTFEEKLTSTGIKIKWKKDSNFLISKDMIISYFKIYGSIEDVQIKENKAYILFMGLKSVDLAINDNTNTNLRKLFKIKKFSSKDKDQKEYEKEKFKFLDTNTLNAIRNFKNNPFEEFPKPKEKVITNLINEPEIILDKNKLDNFEDYESQILAKLKNKFKK